jgi:hypothetical protein
VQYLGGVALRVIRETQVAARLRQRVHWKNLSYVPAEVQQPRLKEGKALLDALALRSGKLIEAKAELPQAE